MVASVSDCSLTQTTCVAPRRHAPGRVPNVCRRAADLLSGEQRTAGRVGQVRQGGVSHACQLSAGMVPLSAVGFEPTRSCLQWILSPPLSHSGKLTRGTNSTHGSSTTDWPLKPCSFMLKTASSQHPRAPKCHTPTQTPPGELLSLRDTVDSSGSWPAMIQIRDPANTSSQLGSVLNCQLFTQDITEAVILYTYSR